MAVWQCDFHLVPRRAIAADGTVLDCEARKRLVRDAWSSVQPPDAFADAIATFAPPAPSWNPEVLSVWGVDDGNRIDVFTRDGRVASVRVRVDLRSPDARFLGGVLDLVHAWDCILLGEQGLVAADAAALVGALARSRAFQFVADPRGFIDALAKARRREH